MDNKLSYSDITSLAGELKTISGQIEDLISVLKDQDYIRIGDSGDIWTGDAAEAAHKTFEELTDKFPNFVKSVNDYSDYLVDIVAQR